MFSAPQLGPCFQGTLLGGCSTPGWTAVPDESLMTSRGGECPEKTEKWRVVPDEGRADSLSFPPGFNYRSRPGQKCFEAFALLTTARESSPTFGNSERKKRKMVKLRDDRRCHGDAG